LTEAQKKTIEEIKEKADDLAANNNQNQLKEMLKKNNQPTNGNKKDNALRIADGQIRGVLPKCSKCSGGNLHLNLKDDTVFCKGYMDDEKFVNCSFSGPNSDVKRTTWQN